MKKSIFTTLALSAGLTFGGLVVSDEAKAADVDYSHLAQAAQNNDVELSQKPIQKGNYDFSFSDGKFTYHFYNYNGIFGYEYHTGSTQVNNTSSQLAAQEQASEQKVDQQQAQFDTNHVANIKQPKQVEAPKKEVKQESVTPVQKETKSVSGGSVKAQFLQAGGTEAMWNNIVMPESTGNPNAVNPAGYRGLGQTKESWGTGSVAEQTKGMINYAKERYGSIDNAISARQSKGWW